MCRKGLSRGLAVLFAWVGIACGQTVPTAARIESVPLELTMPERYQVAESLEPIRRVTLLAPADGFIRSMEVRLGETVRGSQEIAQLDRTEASARLKMASAEVKEKQSVLKSPAASQSLTSDVVGAQIEAAEARVELAQLALDRCTLRAPFAGRLVDLPVCAGQYVLKGTTIAELADLSSLKTLLPVDRRDVAAGAPLTVHIEGQDVAGKVQAVLPLPERYTALRELATPFAAAWVALPNTKGDLEPGLRVRPTTIPVAPIATVPKRAVKQEDARKNEGSMVQVIRNEYVTNVPVRVLGETGTERVQITGSLRGSDALILSSSVSLLPGTLIRFGEGTTSRGIEGVPPNPAFGGAEAGITAPAGTRARGAISGSSPNQTKPAPTPPRTGSAPF
jgi:multidrug efflux pump subunit AcrA (membrane-fusion protein)